MQELKIVEIVNEKDIERLLKLDKIFLFIYRTYGAPPGWKRQPGFMTLSKIILEQQVSLASANAHFVKLNNGLQEFTPANILRLTDEEMRICQISRQKAKYLRELSTALIDKTIDLTCLHKMGYEEVKTELMSIKGIGDWTADVYSLFCLQFKDVFPIGDVAVVNTVKELTDAVSKEQILARAERWRPLRSLATYFLWHYYLKKRNRKPLID